MASLLDIGPLTEEVMIRGIKLDVSGVPASDLFKLITKFPEFRAIISGLSTGVTPEKLVGLGSDVAAMIIATVTGSPGNQQAEAKAKQLSAGEQVEIIAKAFKLTFPFGVGPFVDQLTTLAGAITGQQQTQINSPVPLQEPSLASLNTDSDLGPRGRLHRVN